MSEEQLVRESKVMSKWEQHRFLLMVGGVILVSLFLVSVALALYASSGAAQVDLSRPGYQSVRGSAGDNDTFDGFSANGPLDKKTLGEFRSLYDTRAKQITDVDSFGGGAMSDESLSISETSGVK